LSACFFLSTCVSFQKAEDVLGVRRSRGSVWVVDKSRSYAVYSPYIRHYKIDISKGRQMRVTI
jgi:hypothetical protein